MDPVIRIALLDAIPSIRRIAQDTWPVAYGSILPAAQLTYMLELMYSEAALSAQFEQGHVFLLACTDERTIGFASYETGYKQLSISRIHKLYVLPERQRSGIGAALLNAITTSAHATGDQTLNLNVNRFNKAKAFYARRGFRIVRDEVIDIGNGFVMDDHVMERSLSLER